MKLSFGHHIIALLMLFVFTSTTALSATYAISIEPEGTKHAQLLQKDVVTSKCLLAFTFEEKDANEDDIEQLGKRVKQNAATNNFIFYRFFSLWDFATGHHQHPSHGFLAHDTPTFLWIKVFRL